MYLNEIYSPMGLMKGPGNYNGSPIVSRWIGQKGTTLPSKAMFENCIFGPTSYNNFWTCVWYLIH